MTAVDPAWPLVGVTQRVLPPTEHGEVRTALDVRWTAFLAACGFLAVPLPHTREHAVAVAAALPLCGLVLSGGDDLAAPGAPVPDRDRSEAALLTWAVAADVGVLGVCRGMQLIARAFGGEIAPLPGHVGVRHDVRAPDGTVRSVNSYHAHAITRLSPPLVATATAGPSIEALRHDGARVQAVMWHPERDQPFSESDLRRCRALFDEGTGKGRRR